MPNNIGWCDETWNPIVGCLKVSCSCRHCYAANMATRFKKVTKGYESLTEGSTWTGDVFCYEDRLNIPYSFKGKKRIFPFSMGDVFYYAGKEPAFLKRVLTVVEYLPQHTWLFLTKHIFFDEDKGESVVYGDLALPQRDNVWLGVTVDDVEYFHRVEFLKDFPVKKRFISFEPLKNWIFGHNPPRFRQMIKGLDWVIIGAESGNHHKSDFPHVEALNIINACREMNIPVYVKSNALDAVKRQLASEDRELLMSREFGT